MKIQHLMPILFLASFCTVSAQTNGTITNKARQAFPIRVQLLSITNDAAGTKLAKYELLNSGKDRWMVLLPVEVDYGEQFNSLGAKMSTDAVLKAGETMEMSIPVERSSSRWRLMVQLLDGNGDHFSIATGYFPPNTNGSLTVEQATYAAQRLANDEASTKFQTRPWLTDQQAKFVAGHWLWVATQGYGQGDIQAKVVLAPDGSTNSVNIELLDNQIKSP